MANKKNHINSVDKVGPILLGVLLVLLGGGIIYDPTLYNSVYSYTFDFTGYNVPLGIFMIIVGIGFIWTSLRKRRGV